MSVECNYIKKLGLKWQWKSKSKKQNWPIKKIEVFTTVVVEPQQASNSPSPECKEFITQPKWSPFFFTLSHVVIIHIFSSIHTHIFDVVTLCLRPDFVWKQKTNTNRAGLKDLFSSIATTSIEWIHSHILIHEAFVGCGNVNQVATRRSCPSNHITLHICGHLLPAVLLILSTWFSYYWVILLNRFPIHQRARLQTINNNDMTVCDRK